MLRITLSYSAPPHKPRFFFARRWVLHLHSPVSTPPDCTQHLTSVLAAEATRRLNGVNTCTTAYHAEPGLTSPGTRS